MERRPDRPRVTRWFALALVAALAVAACGPAASASPTASGVAPSASPGPSLPVASSGPVDPATALRIAEPWTLDDAFPEVRQQLLDGLAGEGFRAVEVRHVTGPDDESAFVMAADAGLGPDTDLEDYARRLSETSSTGGGVETLGDHEVALLQTDEVSIVAWIEPPLLLAVYAADAATARRIAGAVLGAPR